MTTNTIVFILSFFLVYLFTPLLIRMAPRMGTMDMPNERKVHCQPIPRFGGPGIYLGFTVAAFLGLFFFNRTLLVSLPDAYYGLFVGQFIIFGVGAYDDIKGSSPLIKFGAQIAAAAVVIAMGATIPIVTIPSIEHFATKHALSVHIAGALSWALPMLWIVGITNAFNLIDGLDGLAAGLAFIAAATLFIAAVNMGNLPGCMMYTALAGAALSFLRFNYYPAKIFLGDSGSMFIGFTLASLSIIGRQKSTTAAILLTPLVVMGIPIFDTLLAIVRRLLERRPIFSADKKHLHHSLLARGLHHKSAVNAIYAAALIVVVVSMTAGILAHKIGIINIKLLVSRRVEECAPEENGKTAAKPDK